MKLNTVLRPTPPHPPRKMSPTYDSTNIMCASMQDKIMVTGVSVPAPPGGKRESDKQGSSHGGERVQSPQR